MELLGCYVGIKAYKYYPPHTETPASVLTLVLEMSFAVTLLRGDKCDPEDHSLLLIRRVAPIIL